MNSNEKIFKVIDEDVSHERLDGEVIAINLKSGHYFSMSGPAADVWFLIHHTIPQNCWPKILGNVFNASILENVFDQFVEDCKKFGLITYAEQVGPKVIELPADYIRDKWTKPRLEEFDDMCDLILIDPIHDTSLLGWPHIK
jgi:hypothetical protein